MEQQLNNLYSLLSGSSTQTAGTLVASMPFWRRASRSRFSGVNADGAPWRLPARIGAERSAPSFIVPAGLRPWRPGQSP